MVLISADTGPREISEYAVYYCADQRRDPPLTYNNDKDSCAIRGAAIGRMLDSLSGVNREHRPDDTCPI